VRALGDNNIEIKAKENHWAVLSAGRSVVNLPGLNPEEFPPFPAIDTSAKFALKVGDLISMFDSVAFAAAGEQSRLNLNAIYVERVKSESNEMFRMVATDGHRLAKSEKPGDVPLEEGIMLPRRGVLEMKRIIGDQGGDVRVGIAGNNALFETEDTILVLRLLEGEYPDYEQVIPRGNANIVRVDREAFLAAIRRAQVIASEKNEGITFQIAENQIEIRSGGSDVGDIREELVVEYQGAALAIHFNGQYLLDVLSVLDSEKVRMELGDELSAGMVRPEDDEHYTYVLMPMRV
jgi:DNA polymerase-3 subunit beta